LAKVHQPQPLSLTRSKAAVVEVDGMAEELEAMLAVAVAAAQVI
jgi:hypothetical protein